jgi:SAM-dependent methyltransferase
MRSKATRPGGQGTQAIAIRGPLWNLVQNILGCPDFKSNLYRSVLRPPGRLLDFGCANGHIAEVFLEFDYYGIDIDPDAI